LIGFAGRRVIESTIKQELPADFQKAEFLMKHGFIDAIIPRQEMRGQLTNLLNFHAKQFIPKRETLIHSPTMTTSKLAVWDRVRLVRSAKRPSSQDYIEKIFEGFFELHGDRCFSDDPAIMTGLTRINGIPVTMIAQQKGHQMQERMEHNFGMSNPEGYRKALRMIRQSEKFNRPIIFLVDTPGAYPGIGAEERGQARAIADNLSELASVTVPVITLVVGEGGSGGALALSVGDRVIMLENSIYSVITPEGCASILWRDASLAPQAAEALKLTADDLLRFGLIDRIIPEGEDFSNENMDQVCQVIQEELWQTLLELRRLPRRTLVRRRQNKYLAMTRSAYSGPSANQYIDAL
jgi:acetyl-CoA carboxylase carboxyl transferase subunit beta